MKKLVFMGLSILLAALLTSCEFNLFGVSEEEAGDYEKGMSVLVGAAQTLTAQAELTGQPVKPAVKESPQPPAKPTVQESPVKPSPKPKVPVFYQPEIPGIVSSIPDCQTVYTKWESFAPQKDISIAAYHCKGENNLDVIEYVYFLDEAGYAPFRMDSSYKPVTDIPKIGEQTSAGTAEVEGLQKFWIGYLKGFSAVTFSITAPAGTDPAALGIELARKAEAALPQEKHKFDPVHPIISMETLREKSLMEKWTLPPLLFGLMTYSEETEPLKTGVYKDARPARKAFEQEKSYIYFILRTVNDQDIPYVAAIKGRTENYHLYIYAPSSKEGIRLALNNTSNLESMKQADIWLVFEGDEGGSPVAYQASYDLQ